MESKEKEKFIDDSQLIAPYLDKLVVLEFLRSEREKTLRGTITALGKNVFSFRCENDGEELLVSYVSVLNVRPTSVYPAINGGVRK